MNDAQLTTRPAAIFLLGPTASGKTALACALQDRFAVDLISVDSALVYRGLDIGAAKPTAATLARHPHALIDIADPSQPFSAAMFRDAALEAMRSSVARGRTPLLVGGTMLYFRALADGLDELPEGNRDVRARLGAEAMRVGWPALHARLAAADPASAARIKPNDAQRIQRALEVLELTGKPLSTWQQGRAARLPYRILKLALVPPRAELWRRIEARFDAMLAAGFLDEVRRLRSRGDLGPDLPALRAVGYRQAWRYLDGVTDASTFRAEALAATRQLAKRQTTWLRSMLDARWLQADGVVVAERAVADFLPLRRFRPD